MVGMGERLTSTKNSWPSRSQNQGIQPPSLLLSLSNIIIKLLTQNCATGPTMQSQQNTSGGPGDEGKILLKCRRIKDSNEITLKVKMTTKLGKLFESVSTQYGVGIAQLRFSFDGDVLDPLKTVAEAELENEDQIDVTEELTGGR